VNRLTKKLKKTKNMIYY